MCEGVFYKPNLDALVVNSNLSEHFMYQVLNLDGIKCIEKVEFTKGSKLGRFMHN